MVARLRSMAGRVRSGQALVWTGTALAVAAIFVGDVSRGSAQALWTAAFCAMAVAFALTFARPYRALLAVGSVAVIVAVSYVVPASAVPHWLRASIGVALALAWLWMYLVSPLRRRVGGHS